MSENSAIGVCWIETERTMMIPYNRVIEIVAEDIFCPNEVRVIYVDRNGKNRTVHTINSDKEAPLRKGFWFIGEAKLQPKP